MVPLLVFAALLVAADPADPIQDHAGIFSADAVKTAQGILADIKRRFEMDVVVETFKEIPADRKAQYAPEKKDEFFQKWAMERANSRKVQGVYILVCMDVRRVEVGADRAAQRRAFKPQNRAELTKIILDKFRQKDFDAGLIAGLDFVRNTVTANLKQ